MTQGIVLGLKAPPTGTEPADVSGERDQIDAAPIGEDAGPVSDLGAGGSPQDEYIRDVDAETPDTVSLRTIFAQVTSRDPCRCITSLFCLVFCPEPTGTEPALACYLLTNGRGFGTQSETQMLTKTQAKRAVDVTQGGIIAAIVVGIGSSIVGTGTSALGGPGAPARVCSSSHGKAAMSMLFQAQWLAVAGR